MSKVIEKVNDLFGNDWDSSIPPGHPGLTVFRHSFYFNPSLEEEVDDAITFLVLCKKHCLRWAHLFAFKYEYVGSQWIHVPAFVEPYDTLIRKLYFKVEEGDEGK